jgi:hypothetical protein
MRRFSNFLTAALIAWLVLEAGPLMAGGGDAPVSGGTPAVLADSTAQVPVAAQGLQVYRDPQTGKLGPPPPGWQPPGLSVAEQRMLNRSDQGLQSTTLPGGAVAVDLQGRFMNMAVARVRSDGQAAVNCAITPDQATAHLQPDH